MNNLGLERAIRAWYDRPSHLRSLYGPTQAEFDTWCAGDAADVDDRCTELPEKVMTLESVGRVLGLSHTRVLQIEREAIRKIRYGLIKAFWVHGEWDVTVEEMHTIVDVVFEHLTLGASGRHLRPKRGKRRELLVGQRR